MSKYGRKGSWKVAVLSVLCVLLTLVLLVLIAATVFLDRMLGKIDRVSASDPTLSSSEIQELIYPTETRGEDYTGPAYDSVEITMPTEPAEIIEADHTINILLIGQDRRGSAGRSLSDAMILCTINKEKKTLVLTSFLRDTYVQIPGQKNNKLNAAYPLGGMELLDATLELNFGVKIDGNVEVDFSQFARIVDLLGGIDIELTAAEVENLQYAYGFELKPGWNHLNGEQALGYSRIRKIGTDFGRTNRQRIVLMTILEKFRNVSTTQAVNTVSEILEMVTTDLTDQEILAYALELAPMLQELEIVSQSIPIEGSYRFGDVKDLRIYDCIFIDFEANRKRLQETLGN